MGECRGEGTATFMILGNICTRACGFCGVKTGRPESVDWDEPEKVARSIKIMEIKHAVLTSVDRDDLKDMGSIMWAETVKAVRRMNPNTTLETLIPDFQGIEKHIDRIINVAPEVVSHNMETVRRLTKKVRIQAKYDRSLDTLRYLYEGGIKTKSGVMLGLGETEAEVVEPFFGGKALIGGAFTEARYLNISVGLSLLLWCLASGLERGFLLDVYTGSFFAWGGCFDLGAEASIGLSNIYSSESCEASIGLSSISSSESCEASIGCEGP